MNLSKKIEDKRKAKQRAEKVKKAKIATAGVVLGAVTGAVSGVLLAPKSGKETREDTINLVVQTYSVFYLAV